MKNQINTNKKENTLDLIKRAYISSIEEKISTGQIDAQEGVNKIHEIYDMEEEATLKYFDPTILNIGKFRSHFSEMINSGKNIENKEVIKIIINNLKHQLRFENASRVMIYNK